MLLCGVAPAGGRRRDRTMGNVDSAKSRKRQSESVPAARIEELNNRDDQGWRGERERGEMDTRLGAKLEAVQVR